MADDTNQTNGANGANGQENPDAIAFGELINAVSKHVGKVVINTIKDDYIDPFQQQVDRKLEEIHSEQKMTEELLRTNVLDIVKSSRREILEGRLQEFDIEGLIKKLTELPDAIASNMLSEKSQRQTVKILKDNYEVELSQLSTTAGQSGMIGSNNEDREAIVKLIEDRVQNTDIHGNVVSLVLQSTARDSKGAILECSNLDITKAAEVFAKLQYEQTLLDTYVIDGKKLEIQFKSLRAVASLINTMAS